MCHRAARGLLCFFISTLLLGGGCTSVEESTETFQPTTSPQQVLTTVEGEWRSTGSLAGARLLHTATALRDGRVFVVGGYNVSAEIYDPAAGTWSRAANAPNPYRSATATLLQDGRVLVAGIGDPSWRGNVSAALYTPATNTWNSTGPLATPRIHHTATLLSNGQVLAVGGTTSNSGGTVLGSAEIYDPSLGTWTATGALRTARRNHTATLLADGKVLVAGGSSADGTLLNSAEVYDPATNSWSTVGALSTARTEHTATQLADGRVLVTGGAGRNRDGSRSAELYDPATGTWRAAGSMNSPRRMHSATLLPSRKVLVVGGYHDYTGILTSAELYDPSSNTWSSAGNMAADRYLHTATLLTGGVVLVAGGHSNTNQASAELYLSFYTPEPGAPVGEPRPPQGTSLLVRAVDSQGRPLPGASVTVGGVTVIADANGNAIFEGMPPGRAVAQIQAPGFTPGTVVTELDTGMNGGTTAVLRPLGPPLRFNADQEATVTSGSVQVRIPAGSLIDENGQPVAGQAELFLTPIDSSTSELETVPGPLEGISAEDGQSVNLLSGFMVDISATQEGRQLQLAPGAAAELSFELPSDFSELVEAGDPVPAWWFDSTAGTWRQDGEGAISDSTEQPEQAKLKAGTWQQGDPKDMEDSLRRRRFWRVSIRRLVRWNIDIPWWGWRGWWWWNRPWWGNQSCVDVLVTDQNGTPLPGRTVTASWRFNLRTVVTGWNGRACVPVWGGTWWWWRWGSVEVRLGSWWNPEARTWLTPASFAWCGSPWCTQARLTVPTPCGPAGTTQNCGYTGPASTQNVGICRAGYRVCDGFNWGSCVGQTTPSAEVCGNSIDENCNGVVNDGCPQDCRNGSSRDCYTGPAGTPGIGVCRSGTQLCVNGSWGSCVGQVLPSSDLCGNRLDDDCDGATDEGCLCTPTSTRSCYTGPSGTNGVGVCRPGTETCFANGTMSSWGTCVGQVNPSAELCDGLDNNCNGQTDESNPGGGTACNTNRPGVCAQGSTTCSGGALVCTSNTQPSVEVCDGLDNNCNGQTDEGNPGGGTTCNTSRPGVCAQGTTSCSSGRLVCNATTSPSAELCDGLDNNCDGRTDEGNPGGGTACNTGEQGICAQGTTTCSAGRLVCTRTASPAPELCDGIDNNCNGQTDEGNPGGGANCSTGRPGVCSQGRTTCSSGSLVCNSVTTPSTEICDGLDNDCDGLVDEDTGGASCSTGQQGVCAQGATTCSAGRLVCTPTTTPSAERCDGLDNDCDGRIDNGNPGGGLSCTTGQPGVCAAGLTACNGGAIICTRTTNPSSEVCDGLDNNCDGQIDEGNPGSGASCDRGEPGVCSQGTTTCSAGRLACARTTIPSAEVCDGLDNNCNGQTDEGNPGGGVACDTQQPGVCSAGTTTCSGGALACNQTTQPSTEVCDGLDNNCDGQIDNGIRSTSCSTGLRGVCEAGRTSCRAGAAICEQTTQPSSEVCDGLDNDCDGQTDEENCTPNATYFLFDKSNTSMATRNTEDRTVTLRAGQTLTAGVCRFTGTRWTGDTFIRLVGPAGTDVRFDDDTCNNFGSWLTYTATIAGTYTIRVGCFDETRCYGSAAYTVSP